MATRRLVWVDVAMVIAIVVFIGVIAVAQSLSTGATAVMLLAYMVGLVILAMVAETAAASEERTPPKK